MEHVLGAFEKFRKQLLPSSCLSVRSVDLNFMGENIKYHKIKTLPRRPVQPYSTYR